MFITFEGPEGSGKSVNIAWLAEWFIAEGHDVTLVREPGGTALGERIRELLLDGASPPERRAALLLFEAARSQLVHDVIGPAIAAGTVVLCDRFSDSTLAYQGYGDGLPLDQIQQLNAVATGGMRPDLTILLDIEPELGLSRRRDSTVWNAIDARDIAFHRRVRAGFLSLATQEPDRWLILDGARPLPEVRESIVARLSMWQNVQMVTNER
jgi:dTMP kinase